MKPSTAMFILAAVMTPAVARGQMSATLSKADAQKWSDAWTDARNKGNWAAYGQVFTTDATVVTSDGGMDTGRASIQRRTQELFGSGVYKGVQTKSTVLSVSGITPDVVVIDATFELTGIPGGGTRTGRSTIVVVKQGNDWKAAATRSMVPAKAGALPTQR